MKIEYAKQLIEKTKRDYDEIAEEFSATRRTMWPELGDLDKHVKEGDRVLDIGCGNGKLFGFLVGKNKKFSYVGLDVSEKLIKIAQDFYPETESSNKSEVRPPEIEFKVFDGIDITYPENSFDVVYCLATLPHLPGSQLQVKFLENIRSSAKPGARLILTCWNLWQSKFIKYQLKMIVNCIIDRILGKNECDWGDFYIPWKKRGVEPINRFYHAFTISELNSILLKAGWEVEEIGYKDRNGKKKFNLFAVARKPIISSYK